MAYNDGAGLIRMRQFSSAGTALGDEVVVSGGGGDRDPQIARLSDGRPVVAWSDDVGLNDNVVQRVYSPTLQPLTSYLRVNPVGAPASNADVAAPGDGGYVVAYEVNRSVTDHDLYVQRYDANTTLMRAVYGDDGSVRLAPTVTDAPGAGSSTYNDSPDAIGLPDGGFMINYRNSADGNLPASRITALILKADGSFDRLSEVGNSGSLGPTAHGSHAVLGAFAPLQLLAPGATAVDATDQPSTAGPSTEPTAAWLTQGLAVRVCTNSATSSDYNGGDGSGSSIAATLWQVERDSIGAEESETVWFDGVSDRVIMVGGDDGVFLGDGTNTLDLGNGNDTGIGESGPDALLGKAGVDWLCGMGDADYFYGGNDTVCRSEPGSGRSPASVKRPACRRRSG